jgi:hypothetical protein
VYQGTIITQRKDINNTVRTTDKPKTRVVYVASDKGLRTAQNRARQPSKSNNPIKNSKTVIISEKAHNIISYKANIKRRTSHESNKDNKARHRDMGLSPRHKAHTAEEIKEDITRLFLLMTARAAMGWLG